MIKVLLGMAAILVVVIVGIVAFVAGRETGSDNSPAVASGEAGTFDYRVLNEIKQMLERHYVRPENIDEESLFEAAVNGMLSILNDTGTFYVTPGDFQTSTTLTGSFDGIGATVSSQNNEIVIVAPIKNTPAERAGLRSGDVILEVDGESTSGWTVERTVLRIRGKRGTPVTLKIRHADNTIEEYTITRDTVQVDSVSTEPPGGTLRTAGGQDVNDIGYIYIREFSRRTAQELEVAIRNEMNRGIKGLIIDVRNNGGGLLDTTVSSADLFLERGTILIERDASGRETNFVAKPGQLAPNVPIVVIQNRFSASASEVLVAALMENDRATIVGEKSFGKGTVNSPRKLSDGGALYVTIAEWLTPSGILINNVGIRPDIEVIPTDDEIDRRLDPQLFRAIEVLQGQVRAP
jgi:carboxyl-terminal processing protease